MAGTLSRSIATCAFSGTPKVWHLAWACGFSRSRSQSPGRLAQTSLQSAMPGADSLCFITNARNPKLRRPDMLEGLIQPWYAITILLVGFVACLFGGTIGSLKAIKREWHREDIYSRCIRPNVTSVTYPSFFLGFLLLGASVVVTRGMGLITQD